MRVQVDSVTITAMIAALLAGVIVALENGFAPFGVFGFAAGYAVLMAFVYVPRPFGFLRFLRLFVRHWIGDLGATVRTEFAQPTPLAVFRHWFVADGAQNHDTHTLGAHLVSRGEIMGTLAAYLARHADAPSACIGASSAGDTGRILDRLAQCRNRRGHLAALGAWRKSGTITRIANAIVSAIYFALDASVFCHTAIIPQLPDLEKYA